MPPATMMAAGQLSHLSGALMFLVLTVLLLFNWRGQLLGGLLLVCSALSVVWLGTRAFYPVASGIPLLIAQFLEIARNSAWLVFLYVVLIRQSAVQGGRSVTPVGILVYGLPIILAALVLHALLPGQAERTVTDMTLVYIAYISIALLGLTLLERLFRGTNPAGRWAIKFMCFGIGGIFIYDLFLYSDALLFKRLAPHLLDARGAINAICAPMIALSVARNPHWNMDIFVSRHVIYHSSVILAAGIYLTVMAFVGWSVRTFGGEWGTPLQIVFFFGAILILVTLFFSTDLRARLRIFIAKHFYKNKYDYREEWLGFARTLAVSRDNVDIHETIIKAVAGVIKSPGGALWLQETADMFVLAGRTGTSGPVADEVPAGESFIQFMSGSQWVINIDEYKANHSRYSSLELPEWLLANGKTWVILPLLTEGSLIGFMTLDRPHGNVSFDWEDIDLLKTVGFQTAAYVTLLRTTDALSEARQFETFNRLSAFVVHDIKNIIAQLTLITANFSRYRDNPDFVNDALETITHASAKMRNLLGNLGKGQVISASTTQKIDLCALLEDIIDARRLNKPAPVLQHKVAGIIVTANRDKLTSALEHLIQNAQEATTASGNVSVSLERQDTLARISIIDDGSGMDEEFIKTRLFKPFDTTKGNAGMGIGVYESREIIRGIGGNIRVSSRPGAGSEFSVTLPCLQDEADTRDDTARVNA